MKRIYLMSLKFRNFKGFRSPFGIEPNGADVNIFGTNETGKTSIADGWYWLLFNKDSFDRQEFGIKTTNPDGTPIHNLEHEVEGVLQINGRNVTLRKVYREVYTRKRGSASTKFTGHTTDYFIDGVPKSEKEYNKFIESEIMNEKLFKLITNPMYFPMIMKWQERRALLIEMAGGDVTDEEVLNANKSLSKLEAILSIRNIEDHKKVVKARIKTINEELEKIPVRIDEANRSIPDTTALDQTRVLSSIDSLDKKIAAKREELTRVENGGEVTVKKNRIREIEGELLKIKGRMQEGVQQQKNALYAEESRLRRELSRLESDINQIELTVNNRKRQIDSLNMELERLRQKWDERDAETFIWHDHTDTCAACGQALPADQVEAARQKAEQAFNQQKAADLERISADGKRAKAEKERLEAENEQDVMERIPDLQSTKSAIEQELAGITRMISELKEPIPASDPEYARLLGEIGEIKKEVEVLQESNTSIITAVRNEIEEMERELAGLLQHKAKFDTAAATKERIKQLVEQEDKLKAEIEQLEEELFLTEEFTRTKVNMLEERINSMFQITKFKMFRDQVNGGLEEICEPMYDGVMYNAGLNTAAQQEVGIDIINALCRHFGACAPIFRDNSESNVKRRVTPEGQEISLYVSKEDETLRVEIAAHNMDVVH